jgi:hypothetical protein
VSALSTGITVAADGTFSNPTLGISGLMAQNGYICFGKNFGGLILQWGKIIPAAQTFYFPVAFQNSCFAVTNTIFNTDSGSAYWHLVRYEKAGFTIIGELPSKEDFYIALGY